MEKTARRIAQNVAKSGGLDEERQHVIAYGLEALFQMLLLFVCSLVFGLLFRCWQQTLTVFLAVGVLKASTGGAHSRHSTVCTYVSLASIFLMALIARYVIPLVQTYWWVYLIPLAATFALAFTMVHRLAPVATANKPIQREDKINRLRRQSFLTLSVYLCIGIGLVILGGTYIACLSVAMALLMATLWQCFMLTKSAATFINHVDSVIVPD